jgi:hypothetical protein
MRKARGFGYCHELKWQLYPYYRFCSMRCLDMGAELAMRTLGMIDKTERERRAIKDARKSLAETLNELGLMEPFFHRPPEHIDRIIEACVGGFQRSMVHQRNDATVVLDDEIPF